MNVLEALLKFMGHEEGFDGPPTNRCVRNNNPLNLNFCHQDAAELEPAFQGITPRFAKWPTRGQGVAAAYRQLSAWAERGMNLQQIISTQAPATENDTSTYFTNVFAGMRTWRQDFDSGRPIAEYL